MAEPTTGQTLEDPATLTPTKPWYDSYEIPDDVKNSNHFAPAMEKAGSIEELIAQHVNMQPLVGADKLVMPSKDATDDEKSAFFTKLGRPENSEKYEMPTEGIPNDIPLDENVLKSFKDSAFQHGLSSGQAAELYRWYMAQASDQAKAQQSANDQQAQEWQNTVKEELGQAYDESIDLASKAVKEFGGEELQTFMRDSGWGDHPAMVLAWAKVGKAVASDPIMGEGASREFGMTPTDAKNSYNAKLLDPEFMKAYTDPTGSNPGSQAAIAEMTRLHQAMNPDQKALIEVDEKSAGMVTP